MIDKSVGPRTNRGSRAPVSGVRRRWLLALLTAFLGWGVYAAAQGGGGQDSPGEPAAAPTAPSEELDTFVPSEEVGAEQGVAFPVDI